MSNKDVRDHDSSPSIEIRQNLVDTAVGFLNMEKIINQPESTKRKFLERKGLTKEEIEIAFSQSKNQEVNMIQTGRMPPINYSVRGNELVQLPPPLAVPFAPPRTLWTVIRDSVNVFIYCSGVLFGIRYIYRHYIGPFLTGKSYKSKETAIIEIQKSVMEVLQSIEKTMEKINKNILIHNEKLIESEIVGKSDPSYIADLKSELSTLKSLMINKKTFPASPALSHSIPEWQKISAKNQKESDSASGDEQTSTHNAQEEK